MWDGRRLVDGICISMMATGFNGQIRYFGSSEYSFSQLSQRTHLSLISENENSFMTFLFLSSYFLPSRPQRESVRWFVIAPSVLHIQVKMFVRSLHWCRIIYTEPPSARITTEDTSQPCPLESVEATSEGLALHILGGHFP